MIFIKKIIGAVQISLRVSVIPVTVASVPAGCILNASA
jgi:hypothetical protein